MADAGEQQRVLPLQYVKGVGPRRAEVLAAEGIGTALDVVLNVPRAYVDRAAAPSISALLGLVRKPDIWAGDAATVARVTSEVVFVATVTQAREQVLGGKRKMLKVVVADGSGTSASLVFWNLVEYYKKLLVVGGTFIVSGTPDYDPRWSSLSFHHPEVEKVDDDEREAFNAGAILPKYRMTQPMRSAGITMKLMRHIVDSVLQDVLRTISDPLPASLLSRYAFPSRAAALREMHVPTSLQAVNAARERMKYEELFMFELFMAARHSSRRAPDRGLPMDAKSPRARTLVEQLPFALTAAQRRVINEIMQDMTSGAPMNRLLQGDVGSGKTIVALLCMLAAVDNGYQTVIMAPTELLAEQHTNSIRRLLQDTGVVVEQLVGGQRKRLRDDIRSRIQAGDVHIVVGTHAIFEADISYHKLGLVVIDEQHRFGVAQRAEVRRMGMQSHGDVPRAPHMLVMSATPIPRTLSMTIYGDLDVSVIDELPSNRLPISTHVVFESSMDAVYQHTVEHIGQGRQAYVVYPLVEKSEKVAAKSAVEHYEVLRDTVFSELRVGLLHGQMLWYEKEDVMKAFLAKEYDVLVSTTVIEVGIDVPNATIMIIENAERFGLSQLHQLRGRVGRGAHQSYCFLATKDHFRYTMQSKNAAGERVAAAVRLKTMEETTDGFRIAEVDLTIRGPGDMMGTRQSGLPEFSFANLATDGVILAKARNDAFALFKADPQLRIPEHAGMREQLIRLFEGAGSFIFVA